MSKTYFEFILEYITPQQQRIFSKFSLSKAARKHTDHFFGEGNDVIRERVADHNPDKSEVHKKVEQHLNQAIPHEDYKAGVATDKYGRKVKIGKLVQDQDLLKQFASDNTRSGSKMGSGFTMSFHRGIQVAGQTNPVPNKLHPKGHSWQDHSCKNIEDGEGRDALPEEIKHGTVVAFAHDHTGREVYRATLHPYTRTDKDFTPGEYGSHVSGDKHPRLYHVDSEYGVKKPEFTAHVHDAARRLSAKAPAVDNKGKLIEYKIHNAVYDDASRGETIHHNIEDKHIEKIIKNGDSQSKQFIANYDGLKPKHIQELMNQTKDEDTWANHHDKHFDINKIDASEYGGSDHKKFGAPKVGSEDYERAKKTSRTQSASIIRGRLIKHKNITPEQIHELVTKPFVIKQEKGQKTVDGIFTPEMLNNREKLHTRMRALEQPNTSRETIAHVLSKTKHLSGSDLWIHQTALADAIKHPNGGDPEHFEAAHKELMDMKRSGMDETLASAVFDHSRVPHHIVNAHINSTNDTIKKYALKAAKRLKLGT